MNYEGLFSRAADALRESPIRQMGTVAAQRADLISFAPGYPGADSFAWEDYRIIVDRLLRSRDRELLQYGPTRGYRPLLDALVALMAERHITTSLEEMIVTTGSQQGLDLVARTFIDPGDAVLIELPSYTGAISAFRAAQAALVGVRQEPDGIDLDDLDRMLARTRAEGRRVRFLYVVPNFQNPTGLLMSLDKRRRLLEWASRENVLIVEDDPYGALYFDDVASASDTRAIKADDEESRVVYLSSLSKTLAPAFRTAWVAAPATIAAKLELAKQSADLCTSNFDQRIVLEAIRDGVLTRRVPELRRYYQTKRVAMERILRATLATMLTWATPRGGFFVWASVPTGLDARDLLAHALVHRVIFVVGQAFFVDGEGREFLRLAFSQPDVTQIEEGVRRLAAAVRTAVEEPTAAGSEGAALEEADPAAPFLEAP